MAKSFAEKIGLAGTATRLITFIICIDTCCVRKQKLFILSQKPSLFVVNSTFGGYQVLPFPFGFLILQPFSGLRSAQH